MKTVWVNRRTVHKGNGVAVLKACEGKAYGIVATYDDGRVRTTSGDVWEVRPYNQGGVDFIVNEHPAQ